MPLTSSEIKIITQIGRQLSSLIKDGPYGSKTNNGLSKVQSLVRIFWAKRLFRHSEAITRIAKMPKLVEAERQGRPTDLTTVSSQVMDILAALCQESEIMEKTLSIIAELAHFCQLVQQSQYFSSKVRRCAINIEYMDRFFDEHDRRWALLWGPIHNFSRHLETTLGVGLHFLQNLSSLFNSTSKNTHMCCDFHTTQFLSSGLNLGTRTLGARKHLQVQLKSLEALAAPSDINEPEETLLKKGNGLRKPTTSSGILQSVEDLIQRIEGFSPQSEIGHTENAPVVSRNPNKREFEDETQGRVSNKRSCNRTEKMTIHEEFV